MDHRSIHSQDTATAAGDAPPAPAPFGAIAAAPAAPKAGAFSRLFFWRRRQDSTQNAQVTEKDSKDVAEKDNDIPSGIPDPQDVAHLSPAEQKILTDQTAMNPNNLKVSYFDIFKFATPMELFLNAIGLVMAVGAGCTAPVLVFGKLTNNFVSYGADTALSAASAEAVEEASRQAFASSVNKNALYLVYISIGMLGATYIYSAAWLITGERITRRIREAYMRAILRQNSAFFDIVKPGEIATRIVGDTHLVQRGISTKVPMTLQFAAQFIGGFIVAFIINWKITVVLLAIFPAISIVAGIMGATETKSRTRLQEHLAACGSLAEEAISSIRTVHSFQIHSQLAKLYSDPNIKAKNCAQKQARATAAGIAGIYFCVFSSYALAFWWGAQLYLRNEASVGDIITCFFAVIIASFSLSQAAPNLQAISSALGAANKLLLTIWRVPPIDSASKEGLIPDKKAKGVLEFRNVDFYYPSRPTVKVLDNFSLDFQPGQTTALAGTSGAGKSSVIALIERFYNPVKGEILLDGIQIADYNLRWLRSQIGLVAQEPTLFSCTVWENVAYGLCGTPFENACEAEKRQLVEKACKLANAHEFIEAMHKGYDTPLGERGMLVSGGQKQRLAIARAIVGDPPILLLDEATSALDTTSEKIVQNALDQAAAGRTTIAIAHRLSTIKTADKIAVMAKGRVLEVGTHTALLENPQGAYSGLVQAQALREQAEGAEGEEKKDKDSHALDPLDDPIEKAQLAGQADLEGATASEDEERGKKKPFWRRKTHRIAVVRRILAQAPEMKWHYALAFVCSLATGMVYPVTAIIFGNLLYAFTNPDRAVIRASTNHFAGLFFATACVSAVTVGIQAWCLEHAAAFLATRMRSRSLDATLAQEIAFFDETEHSTGALTSDISDSPEKIKTAFGNNAGVCIQGATVLVGGCIVGLAYTWKVALVAIACLPFMLSAGFAELTVLESNDERSRKSHEGSAQIACENAMAIKTVASLTRESAAIEEYCKALDEPMKIATRTAFISNAFFSASQSFVYPTLALLFWFGGQEVGKGNIDIKQFFITFDALTFGTMEAGNVFKLIPEISTALASARHMFKRFDSAVPQEQPDVQEVEHAKSHGEVSFVNVEFNYPTRPTIPVLQGLDLQAKPGQFIALCGASGSGKTTVTQLLQRFYSPRSGSIKLDDANISDLSIGALRGQMALVQQEPVLYDGSIKFNVGLGAIGEPSEEAIAKACADANIAEFVSTLPDGLDTLVGARGSQLSGGQKQRLAIARALIRNPSILLLDEATSALDSQSEKVVQVALEAAAQARTTIAIAHRLSTIQNADIIYVLQRGKIVESGTHDELQAQNGVYADLIRQQGLDR